MHSLEFDDIQPIWEDTIRFAFEQMLRFVCGNMRDRGEDICTVSGGTLDTIPVIDAALPGLVINVEVLKIVVEVDTASAEITAEEGRMGREDSCDVDMALPAQGGSRGRLATRESGRQRQWSAGARRTERRRARSLVWSAVKYQFRRYLAQKPCYDVAEHYCFIRFMIVWRCGDAGEVPEIALPLVQTGVLAASVEQEDARRAFDKPSAIQTLDTGRAHRVKGAGKVGICRLLNFYLHGCGLVAERADEAVSVAVLRDRHGDFRLYDGVDAADLVGDLPGALEEQRVPYIALWFCLWLGHGWERRRVVGSSRDKNGTAFALWWWSGDGRA